MAFVVLLDANVLVNAAIRDTLLRDAERDMYRLVLSEDILREMRRALETDLGRTRDQTGHLAAEIRWSFAGSFMEGYEPLTPAMTNDEKDRHVLAAAVRANAESVVTFNLSHFPAAACAPYGIGAQHPDTFLVDLWTIDPEVMVQILIEQASDLQGWPFKRLLDRLAQDVPDFIGAVIKSGLGPF